MYYSSRLMIEEERRCRLERTSTISRALNILMHQVRLKNYAQQLCRKSERLARFTKTKWILLVLVQQILLVSLLDYNTTHNNNKQYHLCYSIQ